MSCTNDILAWSEHQAELLRRLAQGERLNEAVDWANVIDEMEAVGRSELRACESLLRRALVHLLRMQAWPQSRSAARWRGKTREFLFEAGRAFSSSMQQRINLADIYHSALQQVRDEIDDSGQPQKLPEGCPCTLNALLNGDLAVLVAGFA